jgi:hypothetical protein
LGTYREAAFRLVCQGCGFEEGVGREQQAVDQMKVLTDQMEAVKIAAVEEFKLSDAYDDNNTKYFLSGFELLRKKSKGKYLDFDFYVFQPYEDDDSMMPIKEGGDAAASADPQLDNDATTRTISQNNTYIYIYIYFLWGPFGIIHMLLMQVPFIVS